MIIMIEEVEMNKDKLIELAKQAGFVIDEDSRKHQPNCIVHTHYLIDAELMRFAELVAAAEREACAKVCEEKARGFDQYCEGALDDRYDWKLDAAMDCAENKALREALEETLLFCETFSNRWDGQTGAHPFGMVDRARAALARAGEMK